MIRKIHMEITLLVIVNFAFSRASQRARKRKGQRPDQHTADAVVNDQLYRIMGSQLRQVIPAAMFWARSRRIIFSTIMKI